MTMDKFDAMAALGLIDDEGATWALMDRDAGPDIVAARMEPVKRRIAWQSLINPSRPSPRREWRGRQTLGPLQRRGQRRGVGFCMVVLGGRVVIIRA